MDSVITVHVFFIFERVVWGGQHPGWGVIGPPTGCNNKTKKIRSTINRVSILVGEQFAPCLSVMT